MRREGGHIYVAIVCKTSNKSHEALNEKRNQDTFSLTHPCTGVCEDTAGNIYVANHHNKRVEDTCIST